MPRKRRTSHYNLKQDRMKISGKIYSAILAMLGFSGCGAFTEPDMYGPPPAPEYGSPYAEFVLKGKVSDTQGQPISDIRVVLKPCEDNNYMNDTVRTDGEGKYLFKPNNPFGWRKIWIIAEDTDGEDNGGEFATKTEELDMKDVEFSGGDGWYKGRAEESVDITLEPKTEPENTER